jgi:branched-chain amino acid transport system permease protein
VSETVAQPPVQSSADSSGLSGPPAPWRPSPPGHRRADLVVLACLLAVVLAAPPMMPGVTTNILSRVATFVIVALSLNILIGYTGQISLGHGAFLGVGGFAAGIAITNGGLPWEFAQLVAVLVGGLFALVLGLVALRVKGLYLALVTLAYGLFAQEVLFGLGTGQPRRCRHAGGPSGVGHGRRRLRLRVHRRGGAGLGAGLAAHQLAGRPPSRRCATRRTWPPPGASTSPATSCWPSCSRAWSRAGRGAVRLHRAAGLHADVHLKLSLTFLFMAVLGGAGSRPGVVVAAVLLGSCPSSWTRPPTRLPRRRLRGAAVLGRLVLGVLLFVPGGSRSCCEDPSDG